MVILLECIKSEKLLIKAAKKVIISKEGVTIPAVATTAPKVFCLLYPIKVATLTAIIPGVDCPMV